jgi:hypothetical protein
MGRLIATTQATLDGVVDPVADWVRPDGDHGVLVRAPGEVRGTGAGSQDLRGPGRVLTAPVG